MKSVEWLLTIKGDKWEPKRMKSMFDEREGKFYKDHMAYDQILRICSKNIPQTTEDLRHVFKWNSEERMASHADINNPLKRRRAHLKTAILFEDCGKNLDYYLKVLEYNRLIRRFNLPPDFQK